MTDNTQQARAAVTEEAIEAAAKAAWHDAVAEAYVDGALSAEQANVMWAKNPYKDPRSSCHHTATTTYPWKQGAHCTYCGHGSDTLGARQ